MLRLLGVFCCPCLTVGPFISPSAFLLYPCRDEGLFDSQVRISGVEMSCCFRLVFTVGMIPVQNFDALYKCGILLLGKNWNRVNRAVLCLIRFVMCVFGAFGWLVPAINPGKY